MLRSRSVYLPPMRMNRVWPILGDTLKNVACLEALSRLDVFAAHSLLNDVPNFHADINLARLETLLQIPNHNIPIVDKNFVPNMKTLLTILQHYDI